MWLSRQNAGGLWIPFCPSARFLWAWHRHKLCNCSPTLWWRLRKHSPNPQELKGVNTGQWSKNEFWKQIGSLGFYCRSQYDFEHHFLTFKWAWGGKWHLSTTCWELLFLCFSWMTVRIGWQCVGLGVPSFLSRYLFLFIFPPWAVFQYSRYKKVAWFCALALLLLRNIAGLLTRQHWHLPLDPWGC